ncbi:hypothetical protein TorRG33x02_345870, partial [Trema orientale]
TAIAATYLQQLAPQHLKKLGRIGTLAPSCGAVVPNQAFKRVKDPRARTVVRLRGTATLVQ